MPCLTLLAVALAPLSLIITSCSQAPSEPVPTARSKAKGRPELNWKVPAGWVHEKSARSGRYRARYDIPKSGNSRHPATLVVEYLGRSKEAANVERTALKAAFEKGATVTDTTEKDTAGRVEWTSISGSYNFPLGPKVRGRSAANVLKKDWRAMAAILYAANGVWWFHVEGPEETIENAAPGFRTMVSSCRISK